VPDAQRRQAAAASAISILVMSSYLAHQRIVLPARGYYARPRTASFFSRRMAPYPVHKTPPRSSCRGLVVRVLTGTYGAIVRASPTPMDLFGSLAVGTIGPAAREATRRVLRVAS
jgi:hypothetical protein